MCACVREIDRQRLRERERERERERGERERESIRELLREKKFILIVYHE